ncbi:MAG: hypothetical protein FGM24_07485 [Candidatus Kapabacteria bacterium]|nr:hypothetical protein [Candidatus Kapabacteria bacterium]
MPDMLRFLIMTLMAVVMAGCSDGTAPTPQTGSITGTVVTETDAIPVPSAVVSTTPPTSSVLTDAQGTFTMTDLQAGTYVVKAEKSGQGSGTSQVAVMGGKTTQCVVIVKKPDPTKGAITGTVRSAADNTPIASALVELVNTPNNTLTAADGTYAFSGVAPGAYDVRVSKDSLGSLVQSTTVTAGSTSVVDFSIRVAPLPPVTDGLVAYFPLDGRGDDISGRGYVEDVTIRGVDPVADRKGRAGSASQFRGTNESFLSAVVKQGLQDMPLTISWWMRRTAPATALESLISKYLHPSGEGVVLVFENGNLTAVYTTDTFANYARIDVPEPQMDSWNHCAFTCSTSGAQLFINGELAMSVPWLGIPSNSTTDEVLRFGLTNSVASPGLRPDPYAGQLDDVAWYNRVLTPQEVQTLSNDR